MSRKQITRQKRQLILDPKHKDILLSRFIRKVMMSGKLSLAQRIVYQALDLLEERTKEPGHEVALKALENVKPLVRVKARRVGGSTYQVPMEVSEELGWSFAMRWVIDASRKKSGKDFAHCLADELGEAYEKRGDAFRKREETHRMADANRAYAHFRA